MKPSEKAMQVAQRYANAVSHLNRKEKDELAIAWAKEIEAYAAKALEAQHRKTWAFAMDYADSQLSKKFVGCRVYQVVGYFPEKECPPIEATKDK